METSAGSNPVLSAMMEEKIPCERGFLATVFQAWMLAFVTMFVVIVAILFCNRFHCKFSCHSIIITYF